jgi:hypothetical protein
VRSGDRLLGPEPPTADAETLDGPYLSGDSAEQQAAELVVLAEVTRMLNATLTKTRRRIGASSVEVDGLSEDPPILVEAWAHQGAPRPAQKCKVMADALKLLLVERALFPDGARKVLALTDGTAAAHFSGRSWMAEALRQFGVEVMVVELPVEMRERIRCAQRRQFR